jgi:hypothetical protein
MDENHIHTEFWDYILVVFYIQCITFHLTYFHCSSYATHCYSGPFMSDMKLPQTEQISQNFYVTHTTHFRKFNILNQQNALIKTQ